MVTLETSTRWLSRSFWEAPNRLFKQRKLSYCTKPRAPTSTVTKSTISLSLLPHPFLQISTSVLKQLVEKIRETLQGLDTSEDIALTKTHFENILQHTKLAEGQFYKGVEF